MTRHVPARPPGGATLPVDNEIYNAPGDIWWDDTQPLSLLRTALNPGRFAYFRQVLIDRLGINPTGKHALDVGCGGGLLAEEFARLGFTVTGVDPAEPSLATARAHAARAGLDITYLPAAGEDLPFGDATFDLVYCCDVLEHVLDLDTVIAETARVLKPGGIYLYDTINRTRLSRFVMITLIQEWPATRWIERRLHDWAMFVRPGELGEIMRRHGIENREIAGLLPVANPLVLARLTWRRRRGVTSYREIGQHLRFRRSRITGISYVGFGIRLPGREQ